MIRKFFSLITLWMLLSSLNSYGVSLRDELEKHDIGPEKTELPDIDRNITSFEVLNNSELFFIAYYLDTGEQFLEPTLRLGLLNKPTQTWSTKSLDLTEIHQQCDCPVGGAMMDIQVTPEFFYLKGHYNPSASKLTVLNRDLTFHDGFLSLGNLVTHFSDETILYQNFQVHFAPWPHPMTLSLYFPYRREHQKIYPLKPFQTIRSQQIEKVQTEYQRRGDDWFQSHNHNWNPEEFGERLDRSRIFVNNDTHSLIFVVFFSNIDTWEPGWNLSAQYFSDTRQILQEEGQTFSEVPEDLLVSFFRNLRALGRRNTTDDDFLALFAEAPTLKNMVQQVWDTQFERGISWKTQLLQREPKWGEPATWKKLIELAIEFPSEPERPVVYIYKNISADQDTEYREFLLEDFMQQYGTRPLYEFLTPENLGVIFHE